MLRHREHNAQLADLLTEAGTTAAELVRSVVVGCPCATTAPRWRTGSRAPSYSDPLGGLLEALARAGGPS